MKILASPAFSNKSANPYNYLLYTALRAQGVDVVEYDHAALLKTRWDIVHYHWPDGYINHPSLLKTFWRIAVLSFSVLICRLRGSAIVWTVHNLTPHDAFYPKLAGRFLALFARFCSGLIFLSEHSRALFLQIYKPSPKTALHVVPHGHYRSVYPPSASSNESRKALGLPEGECMFLYFGMIKTYKNVPMLLRAFSEVQGPAHLVVAGKVSDADLRADIETLAAKDSRVHLHLRFIDDAEIPPFMAAADWVVLPYKNILNSGAALLSLSYNVPVLVPALGSMKEMRDDIGGEWIRLYEGDIKAGDLDAARAAPRPPDTCALAAYDWDLLAAKTKELYEAAQKAQAGL
jgi:beta-1,4-mannosyltransferase